MQTEVLDYLTLFALIFVGLIGCWIVACFYRLELRIRALESRGENRRMDDYLRMLEPPPSERVEES